MEMSFETPLKERIQRSANITLKRKNMNMIIKTRKKYIFPFMGIEPTDQNAVDGESSVLTTMLGKMLLCIASYNKYILSR